MSAHPTGTDSWPVITTADALDYTGDELKQRLNEFASAITAIESNNATASAHGLLPALSGNAATFLNGSGSWSAVAWSVLSGVPSTFTPSAHAAAHKSGGGDLIRLDELGSPTDVTTLDASVSAHGLLRKLNNDATMCLLGTGVWGHIDWDTITGAPSSFTPALHAATHKSGGTDSIKLDELAAPTDNTSLNVSTSAHGLCPKIAYASSDRVLTGTGWNFVYWDAIADLPTAFTPESHAARHKSGGNDSIKLDELAAPTDVTTLNATASVHGLMPKLNSISTQYLNGTGAWSTVSWGSISGVPTSFTPSVHASSHAYPNSDWLALDCFGPPTDNTSLNVSIFWHGLCPKLPNNTTSFLRGDGSWSGIDWSILTGKPSTFAPTAHAAAHKSGGADSIKLDELAAPTDVTTLNASTTAHGLMPKLNGGTSWFMRADGNWGYVPWGSVSGKPASYTPSTHASTHKTGGTDVIKLDELDAPTDNTSLNASFSAHGLLPKLPDNADLYLNGGGTYTALSRDQVTDWAHASTHQSGAADAIKLDDLAAPDNNADLNASTTAHGLCPKIPAEGYRYVMQSTGWTDKITDFVHVEIDGYGSVIGTGVKGHAIIPLSGYITGWQLLGEGASNTGQVCLNIYKGDAANHPHDSSARIDTDMNRPTLDGEWAAGIQTLSSNIIATAGQTIAVNVAVNDWAKKIHLVIYFSRTI